MSRRLLFFIIFTVIGLLAFQITVNKIVGSGQSFTLFEFLAPLGGMFLGPVFGGVSAFFVRALNVLIFHQKINLLTIIRFLPAILAAIYFGTKTKKTAFIFPICIALFLLNPIGRQAWMYSFIWLIPFVASFFKKHLILNSLGATFTAHAVGSVIFLYTFGLTPAIWISLIPVVFIERGVFTVGIWTSCLAFNFALDKITNFKFVSFLKPLVKTELLLNVSKTN